MAKEKNFKQGDIVYLMDKKGDSLSESIIKLFSFVVAFVSGGTGLAILFNTKGDAPSIIGGFALIGIAIAIVYKILEK